MMFQRYINFISIDHKFSIGISPFFLVRIWFVTHQTQDYGNKREYTNCSINRKITWDRVWNLNMRAERILKTDKKIFQLVIRGFLFFLALELETYSVLKAKKIEKLRFLLVKRINDILSIKKARFDRCH